MSFSCPISTRRVDANLVRIISFEVVLSASLLLFTGDKLFALLLIFDFSVRLLRVMWLSPFYTLGKLALGGCGVRPKMCDEAPKRFALYLGWIISLVIVGSLFSGAVVLGMSMVLLLLVCASLEMFFEFCVGCKLYYLLQRFGRLG